MAKVPGLFKRGNVYYYRQRIPLDVIDSAALDGKLEIQESLGTSE